MIAYYENSVGERINLVKKPFRMTDANVFDSDWSTSVDGYKISVSIDVFGKKDEFRENMETLYRVTAVDSEQGIYGKLFINNYCIRCNVYSSEKTGWKGFIYTEVSLIFLAPDLAWELAITKQFYKSEKPQVGFGLDYPFDYPFDYTGEKGGVLEWNIDTVTDSDFTMIVYGPCVNPRILINNNPYEVIITLESDECFVVDSQQQSITKFLSNGTTSNLFDDRGYNFSIFSPLPHGLVRFDWSGGFGYDITVYLKRREAPW